MKKLKYLIVSFSVLLLLIPSFVFADGDPEPEEDPESDLGYVDPYNFYQYGDTSELDSYFYNNFVLLPYLESDRTQYIDTGIKASSDLKADLYFSDLEISSSFNGIFGNNEDNKLLRAYYRYDSVYDGITFQFSNKNHSYQINLENYTIYNILFDRNTYSINGYDHTFTDSSFLSDENIFVFGVAPNNILSSYKLYYFSIYDYSANDGEGALVRSFYPAKSKVNGTYGLYDSVSKILYTSGAVGHPFENPEGSDAQLGLMSRIQLFIGSSVSNIGKILHFAAAQPMILFFLAIGLAGVAIRWARRVVHF